MYVVIHLSNISRNFYRITAFRKETRNTMTSTTNLNSSLLSSKSSGAVATKSDNSRKFTPLREVATSTSVDNSEADLEKDLQLQIENEILRKQAAGEKLLSRYF